MPPSTHDSYCRCHALLSRNFATHPFTLGARLVWVAQGVHDDVGHDLDVILVRDIRILVIDEEHVHEVAACAQTFFKSGVSRGFCVASAGTYPC